MCYRIDYKWKEYLGAGEYITNHGQVYALGKRNLGKECQLLTKDEYVIENIITLKITPDNLYKCFKHIGRGN